MLSDMSNAVANFLRGRGIGRGDMVLLFLRRRWEYWVLMMAMHRLCAIPVPSTNQLKAEDIKKKIVGHWGTVPGQTFIYTHLNRLIKEHDTPLSKKSDKIYEFLKDRGFDYTFLLFKLVHVIV